MSEPSASHLNLENAIESVIDCLIDAQNVLRNIGEELQNPTLKLHFLDESLVRAEFRGSLESILHHEGVHDIEEGGSITAKLNRAWGELKARLGGGDQSLLETAEKNQLATSKAYTQALQQELPLPVRQTLVSQSVHIQLFVEYIHTVRKIDKALSGN
jgi:uncharacterized protein (TIGR02284 family)